MAWGDILTLTLQVPVGDSFVQVLDEIEKSAALAPVIVAVIVPLVASPLFEIIQVSMLELEPTAVSSKTMSLVLPANWAS